MSSYRQIHVSIWKDEWFLDLEPQEKLLFIYLFSNENTSLSGLYKLPLKVIVFETGLSQEYITDTLSKFSEQGKIHYQDGLVWVVNMRRYHETKSPKVQTRINQDIAIIPDCPLKIQYLYGMDTRPQLDVLNLNVLNLNKLKEDDETQNPATAAANFSSSADAERVFQEITGFTTFIPKTRNDDIGTILSLIHEHGKDTVSFCKPFFEEWLKRKYSRSNTGWLDWAISRSIPAQKNGNGKKPEIELIPIE